MMWREWKWWAAGSWERRSLENSWDEGTETWGRWFPLRKFLLSGLGWSLLWWSPGGSTHPSSLPWPGSNPPSGTLTQVPYHYCDSSFDRQVQFRSVSGRILPSPPLISGHRFLPFCYWGVLGTLLRFFNFRAFCLWHIKATWSPGNSSSELWAWAHQGCLGSEVWGQGCWGWRWGSDKQLLGPEQTPGTA